MQGPPGTGKSRVVTNIMIDHALNGKSVLFASRNHQALEAVLPSINKLADLPFYAVRLSRPFSEQPINPLKDPIAHLYKNADMRIQEELDVLESGAFRLKSMKEDMADASDTIYESAAGLLAQKAKMCGYALTGQAKEQLDCVRLAMEHHQHQWGKLGAQKIMKKAGREFDWFTQHIPLWAYA